MSKPSKERLAKRAARKATKKKKQTDRVTYWEYELQVQNEEGEPERVKVIIADDSPKIEHLKTIKEVLKIGGNSQSCDNLVNDALQCEDI